MELTKDGKDKGARGSKSSKSPLGTVDNLGDSIS